MVNTDHTVTERTPLVPMPITSGVDGVDQRLQAAVNAPTAVSARMVTAESVQSAGFSAVSASGSVGSKLGTFFAKAARIAKFAGAALGYVSGLSNIAAGLFQGFWIAKRASMHRKIDHAISKAQTTEEKATVIFNAYTKYLHIDTKAIEKSMKKFEKMSVRKQLWQLLDEYDSASNGLGDMVSRLSHRVKAAVHRLFCSTYPHRNYAQDRKDILQGEKRALKDLLTSGTLTKAEALQTLKERRESLLISRAKYANSAALSRLVSPTFTEELNRTGDHIDLEDTDHQKALIDLQDRVRLNHQKNFKADVAEAVGRVATGALGVVSTVFFKLLILRFVVTALQVAITGRTLTKIGRAIHKLFGGDYPKTFAEDVYSIFARFKEHVIVPIQTEIIESAA